MYQYSTTGFHNCDTDGFMTHFTAQVQAAFAAGALLIFGGWVDARKIVGYIDWGLLLLIGSALGLSKGIVNSGLAGYIGGAIRDSGISADASVFVLYLFTVVSDS